MIYLKIVINTDEMVLHQARTLSVPGSGISALLRCPASASALGRALRLADRCAKNPSLFPPQAAVGILALNSTHCDALGEVLLENEEDDDDRHSSQCGTCHDQAKVGAVLSLQLCNAQRDGQVAGAGQHDQLHEVVVPAVDEGEDGQCTDARLDHGQHDLDKGACLAGTVDAGSFQHFGGDALTELLHQEHAERPAHDGEDDRPDGVVQVQAAHFAQQGDQDDLLGQSHCTHDEGEQQLAAHKALLGQRITGHGGGDGVHQVVGAHALPGQIIRIRVILLHRGTHFFHQRKGRVALGVGVHGEHHAGVAAGDQKPQRIPGHELRRDGRACVVHIGKDAGHLVERQHPPVVILPESRHGLRTDETEKVVEFLRTLTSVAGKKYSAQVENDIFHGAKIAIFSFGS